MCICKTAVLPDRLLPGLVERHLVGNWVIQVQEVLVTFLSSVLIRGVKSELETAVEQMRAVANQLRVVALPMQRFADVIGTALIDRLPSVVRPPKDPGREVGPIRNRWKTCGKKICYIRGVARRKLIQPRCSNRAFRQFKKIVVPKGIGYEDDDVFHVANPSLAVSNG